MAINYLNKTGLGELWGKIKALVPTKVSDLNNDSGYMTGLFLASYGHTSFADIKAAYLANKIVYCKTSTGTDPGLGNQLRQAFLAYVGGSDKNPTSFEFQYYRSVKSHSNSQQGDQVFIYVIDSSSTWSVTTREAYTKIVAGTGLTSSYNNGTLTINPAFAIPANVSDLNNDAGYQTQAQVNALIAASGDDDTTYAISISGNVITLTGSDGNTSTVTLPVYTGGVV